MAIRSPKVLCVRGAHERTLREELVHELLETRARATHFSWEITFHPEDRERELLAELNASGGGDR